MPNDVEAVAADLVRFVFCQPDDVFITASGREAAVLDPYRPERLGRGGNRVGEVVNQHGTLFRACRVAAQYDGLEIMDRVGGGDSFASGLVYGLMTFEDAEKAVNYGAAHGALAMTTPGDTTMASLKEVEGIVGGAGARVQR